MNQADVVEATNGHPISVEEVISSFGAQGWHRTGSGTDKRSGRWLADRVRLLGARAELSPFSLDRYVPVQAFVDVGGREVAGLKCFDAPDTPPEGLVGPLVSPGDPRPGSIGLVVSGPHAGARDPVAEHRIGGAHQGLVVVSSGARPGLAPRNAESAEDPFGIPIVQVGSAALAWLEEAARRGDQVRMQASGRRQAATSTNVIAGSTRTGPGASLIVLTPRSGWWHCAAERGGGLVCWLEAIRVITGRGVDAGVRFLATSGHELGYMGLRRALDADPDLIDHPGHIDRGPVWLHLGANLGARGGVVRLGASDGRLAAVATAALEGAGCRVSGPPSIGAAMGEGSELARRGARYVSLVGTNDWFHLRSDRWPDSVDAPEVERLARATAALAQTLLEDPAPNDQALVRPKATNGAGR